MEKPHLQLTCSPSVYSVSHIILCKLSLFIVVSHNIGCASLELDFDEDDTNDGIIAKDSETSDETETSVDTARTDTIQTDSVSETDSETEPEETETAIETDTDTERDTSSTDIHCPRFAYGWPCSCRKFIVGCDDGSECIGLEGLFDQKTGYCAKSCNPETGLQDCATPYGGLGDCRISDSTGKNFYCALYCETDFHCPPSQTCRPLPSGLFSVCHP